MTLLLWLIGAGVLLLLLVVLAGRRQRRSDAAPHRERSPGVPPSGSPSTNSWTFGGGTLP